MTFLDVVFVMLVLDAAILWSLESGLPSDTDMERARARRIKAGVKRCFNYFFVGAVAGALVDTVFVKSPSVFRPEALWVISGAGVIAISAVLVHSALCLVHPAKKRSRRVGLVVSYVALSLACLVLLLGSSTLLDSFEAALPMYTAVGLALVAAGHLLLGERRAGTFDD